MVHFDFYIYLVDNCRPYTCEILVQLQTQYLKSGSEQIHSFCDQGKNLNGSAEFDLQVLY